MYIFVLACAKSLILQVRKLLKTSRKLSLQSKTENKLPSPRNIP